MMKSIGRVKKASIVSGGTRNAHNSPRSYGVGHAAEYNREGSLRDSLDIIYHATADLFFSVSVFTISDYFDIRIQ